MSVLGNPSCLCTNIVQLGAWHQQGVVLKAGVPCSHMEQPLQDVNCLTKPGLVKTLKYVNLS